MHTPRAASARSRFDLYFQATECGCHRGGRMARSVLIGRGRGWRIDQGTDDWMIGHCPRFPKKGFIRGMVRFRLTGTSLTLVLRYLYINIPVRMFGMLYKSEPWVGRRYATEDGQTKLTNQPSGDSNSKNQAPRFRSSSRSSRTPRAGNRAPSMEWRCFRGARCKSLLKCLAMQYDPLGGMTLLISNQVPSSAPCHSVSQGSKIGQAASRAGHD